MRTTLTALMLTIWRRRAGCGRPAFLVWSARLERLLHAGEPERGALQGFAAPSDVDLIIWALCREWC